MLLSSACEIRTFKIPRGMYKCHIYLGMDPSLPLLNLWPSIEKRKGILIKVQPYFNRIKDIFSTKTKKKHMVYIVFNSKVYVSRVTPRENQVEKNGSRMEKNCMQHVLKWQMTPRIWKSFHRLDCWGSGFWEWYHGTGGMDMQPLRVSVRSCCSPCGSSSFCLERGGRVERLYNFVSPTIHGSEEDSRWRWYILPLLEEEW